MRKIKLAPKRAAWVGQFKPPRLKGATLRPSESAAIRYAKQLRVLIDRMIAQTERDIAKLFESPTAVASHVATDASISSQSRILLNGLTSKFSVMFAQASKGLSEQMVSAVEMNSATGLRNSLKEISGSVTLKTDMLKGGPVGEIAKASVAENVSLIKSIPEQYMQRVTNAVMRSITTGEGLKTLQPALKNIKGMTARRATLIAEDQTRKVYNSIAKGRMQAVGVGKFEWIHTGGSQKPRQEHIDMDGEIYSFDDLPVIDSRTGERGIPGQLPNCRCTMRPVLDFGEDG